MNFFSPHAPVTRGWVPSNGTKKHAAENISPCGFRIATKFGQKVYLSKTYAIIDGISLLGNGCHGNQETSCNLVTIATVGKEQNSIDDCIGLTKIHLLSKFGGNPKSTG